MAFQRVVFWGLLAGVPALLAQSWDTSGNGLLSGNYYFREVIITAQNATSLYGNINFSGSGTYTISAVGFQCSSVSCGGGQYQVNGTYSIAAGGHGFISNQLLNGYVMGLVGANGVFVGSATETGVIDLFIAAPVSGQSTGTLQGSYSLSYLTPFPSVGFPFGALWTMNPNGAGNIGNVGLAVYATGASATNQTIANVKYFVSNNAFVVQFPNSNTNLITGNEYLYSTPDGSFVFGGSPQDFDFIVGVRTGSGGAGFADGLYYEAGVEVDNSALGSGGSPGFDTYYGALQATAGTIVAHQRLQFGNGTPGVGYVFHGSYPVSSNGNYTDAVLSRQYITANGVRIGVGINAFPTLTVALPAPATPGSGVYLNPLGVVSAASGAPYTTGVSRGELITLNGTNLGPSSLAIATTAPVPTTLAGVQVLINGNPVPILETSSTFATVLVPYNITSGIAQIQLTYKNNTSNLVTALVNTTTPGIFTTPPGGVNRSIARHANGTLVTPSNPAKIGETVSVFATGLGDVSIAIAIGGVGPTVNPSVTTNTITAFVGGFAAPVVYAGLAPGLPALYLLKVTIPTGVPAGEQFFDIAGPDSYSSEATISVTSAATGTTDGAVRRPGRPARRN